MIRARLQKRRERALHDDRDLNCQYWWGDRGGYDFRAARCILCNPRGDA